MKRSYTTLVMIVLLRMMATGQERFSENIRLNQIGFYPQAPKLAVVAGTGGGDFYVVDRMTRQKVYVGKLLRSERPAFSGKTTCTADFTALTATGEYELVVPGEGRSYGFVVRPNIHDEITKAAIKGFYYQRMSVDLPERYAGKWHRAMGHPDTQVIIHASAATPKKRAGTVVSSPRGWYDAGDYNKYVVNSGITMGTLLSAYEDFSPYFDQLKLNIPESSNDIPDFLDEILWNLRWMLTMQDDDDGGVYHKCTNAEFDKMIMPAQAVAPRFMVQKSTPATLDFAAVMAQASRVFRKFPQLPGLADSCLTASRLAWEWAVLHPAVAYDQSAINARYEPKIVTGEYGDRNFQDEWIWAASELFATTHEEQYIEHTNIVPDDKMPLPSWSQVRLLGYYTLSKLSDQLPKTFSQSAAVVKLLIHFGDELMVALNQKPFRTVMGSTAKDFIWGSNAVAANQGIALLQAYRLTKDKKYVDAALTNLDYLLGRNATGFSYLTGFGDKRTMDPHHRPSIADNIVEPVPGLLAGGPNPGMQDKCAGYPSAIPDEAYLDQSCSYASNEIAINWNAALVYLAAAMEALQVEIGYDKP
ncbi:MAG: glycoside hydrolase family 9 protein [Bacteroidota bacterium]